MKRLELLIKKNECSKDRANKLRIEIIYPYCSKTIYIANIKLHFKSKKCLEMKALYLQQPDKFEFSILKQIQDTTYDILHNNVDDD